MKKSLDKNSRHILSDTHLIYSEPRIDSYIWSTHVTQKTLWDCFVKLKKIPIFCVIPLRLIAIDLFSRAAEPKKILWILWMKKKINYFFDKKRRKTKIIKTQVYWKNSLEAPKKKWKNKFEGFENWILIWIWRKSPMEIRRQRIGKSTLTF